jgi:hypothetical protein
MHVLRSSDVGAMQNEFPALWSLNDIYICMFACSFVTMNINYTSLRFEVVALFLEV